MILPHSLSLPSYVSSVGEPKPPARGVQDAAFPRSAALLKEWPTPVAVDRIRPPGARHRLKRVVEVLRPRRAMKSASGRRRWSGETEESATPKRSPVEPVVEGFDGDGEDYEP